jgi:hypothetical protein
MRPAGRVFETPVNERTVVKDDLTMTTAAATNTDKKPVFERN